MTVLWRSKPTIIEAVQWTGSNLKSCFEFGGRSKVRVTLGRLQLLAGENGAQGWVDVPEGHWLVCQPGDKSDIWPVADDYFRGKYEPHSYGEDKP